MNPANLPGISLMFRAGSADRVFDLFILLGPIIVLGIALFGRTRWTVALAASYVGGLALYVGYKGLVVRA